ncbi:MAG: type I secretion C-terminal target domain-containing protein, partial [Microcoleus sp. SIO2G3]|nr:type I secretion C-terminal target domain-containing protein [Microcoleus sp. SIO2G3]
ADIDLFVFGDSLSDTGNLFRKTAGASPPSPPYFDGRFSNGALAVEQLAQSLGLPLDSSTNFAIAGARTDRTNIGDNAQIKLGGLLDEIDTFKPQAANLGAGAEDLYLVWAGGNDFFKLIDNPGDPIAVVNTAVSNIVSSVQALAAAGAKNIVVAQTPNFGRIPLSLEAGQLQNLTAVSVAFNTALATALNGFEQASPDKNIILTDLFPVSENIIQNPAAFGFSNVTDQLIQNPSGDPNQFFFFDDVHPTTRGHSIFADAFRSSIVAGITDNITRGGTAKADRLVTFSGKDLLNGRGANDYLEANGGRDVLLGGAGDDILLGGASADRLTGGIGQDTLTGGAGRDRFLYTNVNDGRDTITDFTVGQDLLDLSGVLNQFRYDRPNRFEARVRLRQTSEGAIVRVDTNGDLHGRFKTLALLSGVNAGDLSAANFRV